MKEGAVIRDGFTVTNVESWHSGKGDSRKLLMIINYRSERPSLAVIGKIKNVAAKVEFVLREREAGKVASEKATQHSPW